MKGLSAFRKPEQEHLLPFADSLKKLPFWLLGIILLGVLTLWSIASRADYRVIFRATAGGLLTTLWVSLVAFCFAVLVGLGVGLCRVSPLRVVREVATFFVEIIRGVPMLVILYYIAFIGAPGLVEAINWILGPLHARRHHPARRGPKHRLLLAGDHRAHPRLRRVPLGDLPRRHRVDPRRPVGGGVRPRAAQAADDGPHRPPAGGQERAAAPGATSSWP